MSAFASVLLGILQGLTEFLPVSSSGHLVLVQSLFADFSQPGVLFDVVLHAGTLVAVLIYFRKKILTIKLHYLYFLAIASIPAVLIGYFFESTVISFFDSVKIVGVALLITGFLNFQTDRIVKKFKSLTKISALLVGVAQAFAIIPGLSRSGSTIFAGTFLGLARKKAAEFSFLLSVPAVIGANLFQFLSHGPEATINWLNYSLGFFAAFISGYLAISLAIATLLAKKFKLFAFYCFALGILVLTFS